MMMMMIESVFEGMAEVPCFSPSPIAGDALSLIVRLIIDIA